LRVEVDAPHETTIASSQVWVPGWRTDTGRVVHDTFIRMVVPAGRHTITLTYRPLSFYASGAVALIALILAGIALRRIH